MTIFQIECFVMLSKYLNFTRAAAVLNISQPAFSRSISSLEDELGVKLFIRTSREVSLTEPGKVFLEEANEILTHYYLSLSKVKFADINNEDIIRIGLLKEQLNATLSKLFSTLRKEHPNINLEITEYSNYGMLQALQTDEIDVGFTISPGVSYITNVEWKSEMELELAVALPVGHPLAKKDGVSISELENESFIIFDEEEKVSDYNIVLYLCKENNIHPQIAKIVSSINGALTLVECGEGVCIVPYNFINQFKQKIVFKKIIDNNCKIERVFAWRNDNNNPSLPLFVDLIFKITN